MAVVRILSRDGTLIREVGLPEDGAPVGIGRDRANAIRLDDERVSRAHAEIESNADGFVVRDLGSTNGTWIRGERVDERPLVDGDRIQLGHHILEYRLHAKTRAGATAPFDMEDAGRRVWPTHCSECGAALTKDVRFCMSCGATVEPESTRQRCPHCGQAVPVGSRFCGVCGGAMDGSDAVANAAQRDAEPPPAGLEERIGMPPSDLTVGEPPPPPEPERPAPPPPAARAQRSAPADVGSIELTGQDSAISGSFAIGSPQPASRPASAPQRTARRTGRPHSPTVALVSGVLVPGGAQAYNGQLGTAVLVLLGAVLVVPWILGVVLGVRRAREIAAKGGRRGHGGGWWVAIQLWLLVDLLLAVAVALTLLGYLPWGP